MGGPEIQIRLFGGFSVEVAGKDVTSALPGRKGRKALAFLAVHHPTGATRDEFVDILWSDNRPADPRANLRTLLSRIRDAVGSHALEDGPRLRLAIGDLDTDLARARTLMAAADADREARAAEAAVNHARAAVDILDRSFLPDMEGEWLDRTRRTVERGLSDMLRCIADMGSLAGGDLGDEAIAAARELVERDGYLERSHALLMLALARSGEASEALRVFEAVRQQLLEELGTSPGPELQALHAAILRDEDLGSSAIQQATDTWSPDQIPLPPPVLAAAERSFVGRDAQLRVIDRRDDSRRGSRVLTVVGPPGIGKSRLITQAAAHAGHDGHIVLFGRCDEGMAVPYQPFIEAIGHTVRSLSDEDIERLLGRTRVDLARIVPQLAEADPQPATNEPDTDRYRLFEAVAYVVRKLATTVPVLLILDDLHWADRPTQLMFLHVERAVRDLDVTLLIAHRNTAADQSVGFADLLAEVRRERELTTITLEGLGDEEIRELVQAEIQGPPPESLVEAISRRTGGNPLLARELTRDLCACQDPTAAWPDGQDVREWPVPEGIRQLVMHRLATFAATDRDLLVRAATLGRVARPIELAVAAGVQATVALAALEAATAAGLTVESKSEPGAFAFAHPLIREAFIASTSPARLGRTHLENAERLEQHWQGSELDLHLPELVHHRIAAAAVGLELETAVDWAERAAHHAERQLAYEASAEHYSRALELLTDRPDSRRHRGGLLLGLAAAQWRSGSRDDSRLSRRAAFEIATQLDDPELMADAAIGHERYFELNAFEADEDLMTREALGRLPEHPTARRAQLLARLSRIDHSTGDRARTSGVAVEAVRFARESNDREVLADALNALLLAFRAPGYPMHTRLAAASELIEIGREVGSGERRLEGEAHRLLALVEGGRTTEIRSAVERFGRIVEGVRQPFWVYFRHAWASTFAFIEGHLEQSERLADLATETAMGARSDAADGGAAATVQRMVEQGRAEEVAELAAQFAAEGVHDGVWRSGMTMVLARAGRFEEAKRSLDELVGPDGIRLQHDVLWGMGACLLADAAHAIGDREAARTIYRELEAAPRWIAMAGSGRGFLLVSQRLGQMAQVMGDHPRALAHLADARRQGQDLSAGLLIAWADVESAATLIHRGAPEDVARAEVLIGSVEMFSEGRGLGLLEQRISDLRTGWTQGPMFAL